jgi:hypothetical protein
LRGACLGLGAADGFEVGLEGRRGDPQAAAGRGHHDGVHAERLAKRVVPAHGLLIRAGGSCEKAGSKVRHEKHAGKAVQAAKTTKEGQRGKASRQREASCMHWLGAVLI